MVKTIACLPVAGNKNPYQNLMIDGLNSSNFLNAFNGVDDRFGGIIRTYLKFKPDYIHFDWITSYYHRRSFWLTLLLLPLFASQIYFIKIFTSTKIVWTLHNILPHNAGRISFHKRVRSWFAGQCEWIRVFSETSIKNAYDVLNIPVTKIKILPEGDYTTVYSNNISRKESREKLTIPQNKKTLLYLGLIKPYKGIDKLIDVFHSLSDPELCLIIAGAPIDIAYSNSIGEKIKSLEDSRIIFNNLFIPEDDLQVYYNASDFVVLPFEKVENSGSAIMAMGFKKAIIAPNMGVLQKRLVNQRALLFDDLNVTLLRAINMSSKELTDIGEKNFIELRDYSWKDFSNCFSTT